MFYRPYLIFGLLAATLFLHSCSSRDGAPSKDEAIAVLGSDYKEISAFRCDAPDHLVGYWCSFELAGEEQKKAFRMIEGKWIVID